MIPVDEKVQNRNSLLYNPPTMDHAQRVEIEHQTTYEWMQDFVRSHGRLPPAMDFFRSIAMDHLDEDPDYYQKLESLAL